ncbi:MAG TPA: hypothetical protein VF754_08115 [Pyrinomonadaceae bacterium]
MTAAHPLCVLLAVLCLSNAADTTETASTSVAEPQSRAVTTKTDAPEEIARLINLAARRRKNGETDTVDLNRTWERLGIPPGYFDTCDYCAAEIFRHELDGERGSETVLKLSKGFNDLFLYLVFKRAGGGRWQLLGFVDHDFNRYQASRHRVLRANGRNWLVVRGQEGSGTGYSLYAETWYEVSAKGVRPVLHYPVEGHVAPWPEGVGREFKARFTDPQPDARAVTLSYTVSYSLADYRIDDEARNLYRNQHRVRYAWDEGRREFVFDAARSNIAEQEVAAIADLQVEPGEGKQIGGTEFFSAGDAWKRGGYDVFLKYNLPRLLKLARNADEQQKEWLRRVLADCADTREKRELEAALQEPSANAR